MYFDLAVFASGAVPSECLREDLMLFLWLTSVLCGAADQKLCGLFLMFQAVRKGQGE